MRPETRQISWWWVPDPAKTSRPPWVYWAEGRFSPSEFRHLHTFSATGQQLGFEVSPAGDISAAASVDVGSSEMKGGQLVAKTPPFNGRILGFTLHTVAEREAQGARAVAVAEYLRAILGPADLGVIAGSYILPLRVVRQRPPGHMVAPAAAPASASTAHSTQAGEVEICE